MNPKSKIPEPMKKPILLYLTTLALTALCGGDEKLIITACQ